MIKHADLLTSSLVYNNKYGEVVPYWYARATLATDDGTTYVAGMTLGWVNLKPILITAEWLLKFGFERFSDTFWTKGDIGYSAGPDGECCLWLEYEPGRYRIIREVVYSVHEMQKGWFDHKGEELNLPEYGD